MAQQGSEDSNLPLSTLAALAVVAAVVGIILVFAGPAAYGVVLLGFAFQTWILLLIFWAWRNERRTVPAAAYKALTAEDLATAIKQAMDPAGGQASAPAGSAMNRMQQEAAARAASATSGQVLPMRWSEEKK